MVYHPSQSGSNVFNDTWNNIYLNKHLVLVTKTLIPSHKLDGVASPTHHQ